MKHLLKNNIWWIAGAAAILSSCSDPQVTDCTVSQPAVDHFMYDANDLAINSLYANDDPDTSEVLIPQVHTAPYIQALGLVYDAVSIPERDSIIQKQIHYNLSSSYSIIAAYDSNSAWVNNWRNDIIPTGNSTADQMIADYGLVYATAFNSTTSTDYLIVSSSQGPINAKELSRRFKQLPGVIFAEPNTYWNVFSKLSCVLNGHMAHIVFYEGYGDCYAGCYGYHRWEFDVDMSACAVTFTGYYP